MTLLPLNLAETPNRKQRHRSSPRCPHSADVIMFGFSLFNIVRAAHKVNYMYNSCSILNWLCLVVSNSLRPHGPQSARLLCPWDSPGKKTGVGCHALLQGIFPTWGLNPGLLHCRQILYCLSHQFYIVFV